MSLIRGFLGGAWFYLAIAILAGCLGAAVTHRIDLAAYVRLQLEQSQATAAQAEAALQQLQAFDMKWQTASAKTADALKAMVAARGVQDKQLSTLLAQEGNKDAALAACLKFQLPPSVLQQLPH